MAFVGDDAFPLGQPKPSHVSFHGGYPRPRFAPSTWHICLIMVDFAVMTEQSVDQQGPILRAKNNHDAFIEAVLGNWQLAMAFSGQENSRLRSSHDAAKCQRLPHKSFRLRFLVPKPRIPPLEQGFRFPVKTHQQTCRPPFQEGNTSFKRPCAPNHVCWWEGMDPQTCFNGLGQTGLCSICCNNWTLR